MSTTIPAYHEIIDFIAAGSTPQDVANFHPSVEAQQRIADLLEREQEQRLYLALACVLCNRYKGSDAASIDLQTGKLIRLFNPRLGRWNDHFMLVGATIQPLSEIGGVTAGLL